MLNKGASISRSAHALYGAAAVIVPPVRRGLVGYGRFQYDDADLDAVASQVTRNLAPAGAGTRLTPVGGTPTYDGTYMLSDGDGAGLETALNDQEEVTYIVTACTDAAMTGSDKPLLFGNYGNGGGTGLWLDSLTSPAHPQGRFRANTYDTSGNNVVSVAIDNVVNPHMFAFRRAGGQIWVNNLTQSLESAPVAYDGAVISALPLRVGRGYQPNFTGVAKNLQWAAFRAALTDDELVKLYQFEKAWLALFGISI